MSLSDIVSALERTGPTQAALIIFVITFGVVVARLFRPSQRRAHRDAAAIPLRDAPIHPATSQDERRSHVQA
jgi:cbb3-type cytochrome oxidase subunit 3